MRHLRCLNKARGVAWEDGISEKLFVRGRTSICARLLLVQCIVVIQCCNWPVPLSCDGRRGALFARKRESRASVPFILRFVFRTTAFRYELSSFIICITVEIIGKSFQHNCAIITIIASRGKSKKEAQCKLCIIPDPLSPNKSDLN